MYNENKNGWEREMRFRAYAIKEEENGSYKPIKKIVPDELRKSLNLFGRLEDEDGMKYSPMYIKRVEHLILGTLVQSYYAELKKFSDKDVNKEEDIDADSINDRVFFYIDTDKSIVYIQNKRYPSKTLYHIKTVDRINTILKECIKQKNLFLMPVQINYTLDEIGELFLEGNIHEIQFSNLSGIEVPKGIEIHNPVREWDDTFAKSWNKYSKNTLDSVYLKAVNGETLSKNPIARLCMKLAKIGNPNGKAVFKKLVVDSNGEKDDVKQEGNEYKIINISKKKQEDANKAYECIVKKVIPGYKEGNKK